MGVGAGVYMCDVVKKFTFAISSPDEFLYIITERVITAWNGLAIGTDFRSLARYKNSILATDFTAHLKCFSFYFRS